MSFWKLVTAIVVGNLLTGLVAAVLWLLLVASLFTSAFDGRTPDQSLSDGTATDRQTIAPAPVVTNTDELQPEPNAIPSDAYLNVPYDAKQENSE